MHIPQDALSLAKKEINEAQEGLREVTNETSQLQTERNEIVEEKRKKGNEHRHSNAALRQISKKVGDIVKEKAALEKAKQEAILA